MPLLSQRFAAPQLGDECVSVSPELFEGRLVANGLVHQALAALEVNLLLRGIALTHV